LRYPLFVRRDLDAFFGLAINNLVDLIIIATVGRTLLQLPDELIFGRILPGAGSRCWRATSITRGRRGSSRSPKGATT
jgi:hypothetical protein